MRAGGAQAAVGRIGAVSGIGNGGASALATPAVPAAHAPLRDRPVAGAKRILLAAPRGYCAGVDRAVVAVEKALERYGAPVYVRKQIVHNIHVVRTLERAGAIFVDDVAEVPEGARVVGEVIAGIRELDADPEVDVIIVARGGGDFQHLLVFSDESLVRAAAACVTPLVSAIGHENDRPLLDEVADLRASTPTDAAKAIVPDADAERSAVAAARARGHRALTARLHHERRRLVELRSRPVLTDKGAFVRSQRSVVDALRDRSRRRVEAQLHRARDHTAHLRTQVRTLSPQSTLDRGYAIVQHADGAVVSDPASVVVGELLRVRVARGDFGVKPVGHDG